MVQRSIWCNINFLNTFVGKINKPIEQLVHADWELIKWKLCTTNCVYVMPSARARYLTFPTCRERIIIITRIGNNVAYLTDRQTDRQKKIPPKTPKSRPIRAIKQNRARVAYAAHNKLNGKQILKKDRMLRVLRPLRLLLLILVLDWEREGASRAFDSLLGDTGQTQRKASLMQVQVELGRATCPAITFRLCLPVLYFNNSSL